MKKHLIIFTILILFSFVSGFAYANLLSFMEIKKAYVTNSNQVCGDKFCSPYHQFKIGIPINEIICNDGFELLKSFSNHPNCITPQSVERLLSIGWMRVIQELDEIPQYDDSSDLLGEHSKVFPKLEGSPSIEISRQTVYDTEYINFEGCCWHRLHNVEVTISNESEIIDSIRSQTTDHGLLYMPWPIPEDFVPGLYNIKASDGINNLEFNITIIP